jgi:hypothetical protein
MNPLQYESEGRLLRACSGEKSLLHINGELVHGKTYNILQEVKTVFMNILKGLIIGNAVIPISANSVR